MRTVQHDVEINFFVFWTFKQTKKKNSKKPSHLAATAFFLFESINETHKQATN